MGAQLDDVKLLEHAAFNAGAKFIQDHLTAIAPDMVSNSLHAYMPGPIDLELGVEDFQKLNTTRMLEKKVRA